MLVWRGRVGGHCVGYRQESMGNPNTAECRVSIEPNSQTGQKWMTVQNSTTPTAPVYWQGFCQKIFWKYKIAPAC